MRGTLAVMMACLLILSSGCMSKEQREAAKMPRKPLVSDWRTGQTFVTVKEVEKVEGLKLGKIGQVIIRADVPDSAYFSAAVIPFREIPAGSEVKLKQVTWETSRVQVTSLLADFLVVE